MSFRPPSRKVLSRKFYLDGTGILYVEELVEVGPMPDLPFPVPELNRVVVNRPVAPYLVYVQDEKSL